MRTTTLGQVCTEGGGFVQTGPFGSQLHASDYVSQGVPCVMPQDIMDNAVSTADIARITEDDADRLGRHRLALGDIVYSRRGDVERRALIREDQVGWLCGTGCLRVHFGEKPEVDPAYISYYLGLESSRTWIRQHAVGATMPNLNTQILSNVPLRIHQLPEQRAIAEVLGALDDKIAANQVLRTKLAALSTALYFAAIGSDASTMTVTEGAALLTRGASPKYTDDEQGTLVLNQKCVRDGDIDLQPARRTEPDRVRKGTLLMADDVLVNSTGTGTLGRVARWTRSDVATVDSHVTIVRPDPGVVDPAVFGVALLQLQAEIEGLAEGSTGQTELSRQQLGGLPVVMPSPDAQAELGVQFRALAASSLAAHIESERLTSLRDALLPELMSGRMRVKDAEAEVEGVL